MSGKQLGRHSLHSDEELYYIFMSDLKFFNEALALPPDDSATLLLRAEMHWLRGDLQPYYRDKLRAIFHLPETATRIGQASRFFLVAPKTMDQMHKFMETCLPVDLVSVGAEMHIDLSGQDVPLLPLLQENIPIDQVAIDGTSGGRADIFPFFKAALKLTKAFQTLHLLKIEPHPRRTSETWKAIVSHARTLRKRKIFSEVVVHDEERIYSLK